MKSIANTLNSIEIGFNPEAIFALSGGIAKCSGHNHFRTTAFSDLDPRGYMGGGKSRTIAAVELVQIFPEAIVVPTSQQLRWQVMAQELKRYGVHAERIIRETESYDTISNLSEMIKFCYVRKWSKVAVLSNEWHLPRIMLMYEQILSLLKSRSSDDYMDIKRIKRACKIRGFTVAWISAEDILLLRSKKYKTLLDKTRATTSYRLRIEAELRGITDLLRGTYKKL